MGLKYFPMRGLGDRVLQIIDVLDSIEPRLGSRKSLGPMMSKPLKASLHAFVKFIDRNLNEYSYFRMSKLLADEVIRSLEELHGNKPIPAGIITYGGSEANLTSLYIMRELGYDTVVVPQNAHESVLKASRILKLRVVRTGVNKRNQACISDVVKVVRKLGKRRVFVVLTAGNTETGTIDDVKQLYEELPDTEVVVDAAFGGLITPFIEESSSIPYYGFKIPTVACIGIDGHKMGLTPIPSGALILRNNDYLKPITFKSKYFINQTHQYSLLWTRTAASAAALWASINYLGFYGFKAIVDRLIKLTRYLTDALINLNCKVVEPDLPIICFSLGKGRLNHTVMTKLIRRGWHLYRCPFINGIKVTLMPHTNEEVINEFLSDLKRTVTDSN